MTKCKFTTVACQGDGCQKEFQRDQYHPNCTLCPECRKERDRQANRENQRAKYHAMKEEDRRYKRENAGKAMSPTTWDEYCKRKQRERARRKLADAPSNPPEPVRRSLDALESVVGRRQSVAVLLFSCLFLLVVSFVTHGCLADFQDYLDLARKKLSHEPGGSASPSASAAGVGIERYLQAMRELLPSLEALLSPVRT